MLFEPTFIEVFQPKQLAYLTAPEYRNGQVQTPVVVEVHRANIANPTQSVDDQVRSKITALLLEEHKDLSRQRLHGRQNAQIRHQNIHPPVAVEVNGLSRVGEGYFCEGGFLP